MIRNLFILASLLTIISVSCKPEPPTEKYIKMEEEMNTQLPRLINKGLSMDKVKAISKHKFKYYYTFLDTPDISEGIFIKESKKQIIRSLRRSRDSREFKDDNITIVYSYSKKDGNTFAEFEIKPEEY